MTGPQSSCALPLCPRVLFPFGLVSYLVMTGIPERGASSFRLLILGCRSIAWSLTLGSLCLAGAASGAQAADWPPLPPEDLKMTSVPEQPGAPAIVLLRDELADDPLNVRKTYMRIKILTEEGRRYADVELPYSRRTFRVEDVSGRTIHPDGTVVPFDGKVFDKQTLRTREAGGPGEHYNVKSFTLPDVQVGSVIEYRYSLRYETRVFYAPHWEVQTDLFQRKATFKFVPYEGFVKLPHDRVGRGVAWTSLLPKGVGAQLHQGPESSQARVRQSSPYVDLEVRDMPPVVHEPYMPPADAIRYRVDFYYMITRKEEEFWRDEGKFWSRDVESFLGKRDGVDAAARAAVVERDPPEQKVKRMYALVGGLDNWSYEPTRAPQEDKTLGIRVNKGAEDVLRQHGGDHDDLNRLFVAMVRSLGIPAYLMLVPSRDRQFFDPAYMSMRQFSAEIAIVPLNGKDLFLDPGTKFCPYGVLDWRYSQQMGVRQSSGGSKETEFATSPVVDYMKTQVMRAARLKLNEQGRAEGTVRVGFYGQRQLDLRQAAGRTDAEGRRKLLEDEMKSWLPGDSEVTLVGTPDWDSTEPHVATEFKISAPVAVPSGRRWVVPAHIFQVNEKARFAAAKRVTAIYFDYPFRELDEVHLTLAPGMEIESLPGNDKVQTEFAVYSTLQKEEADHGVMARRDLVLGQIRFPQTKYDEVKGFFDKVKAGDDQPLLLKGLVHAELW